jgi:hypothetical protein
MRSVRHRLNLIYNLFVSSAAQSFECRQAGQLPMSSLAAVARCRQKKMHPVADTGILPTTSTTSFFREAKGRLSGLVISPRVR